jgi:hypothetical protein
MRGCAWRRCQGLRERFRGIGRIGQSIDWSLGALVWVLWFEETRQPTDGR